MPTLARHLVRLLVVAPFLPDPTAAHGGGLYLGTLCQALARRVELGLVALLRSTEIEHLERDRGPFAWVSAVPMRERPRGLGLLGHQAAMLWRWGARGVPLLAAKHESRAMTAALRRAVREFAPSAALVELAQTAQYLPALAAIPTVLTDHEGGLPANAHTDLGAWADRRDARLWQRYVARYYPLADLLQAVTDEDAEKLEQQLGRPVAVRPPVLRPPADTRRTPARRQTAPRALFLGNYLHYPNLEAARVVARDLMPRLRARVPAAELWLAGAHTERLQDLATLPGVRVEGFAADLAALFAEVRVLLAPLYSGAGFRMKTLTALAHGVPVVTNELGARGIHVPVAARQVAEGLDELAEAAARLLTDAAAATAAGDAARDWARSNLAPETVAETQLERISALLAGKPPAGRVAQRPPA